MKNASTRSGDLLADDLSSKPGIDPWLGFVSDPPVLRRGMQVQPAEKLPPHALIESLKHRIAVAEEERDALRTLEHEEDYLRACSTVEALELQLEERLRQAVT